MRFVRLLAMASIVTLFGTAPLNAGDGLNPEVVISTGVGGSPDIAIGFGDSVIVTFVDNDQVSVQFSPEFGGTLIPLTTTGIHGLPQVFVSNSGVTSVVFEGPSPLPMPDGPDIFLGSNEGGAFDAPDNLTGNSVSESAPRITGGNTGPARTVAWLAELGAPNPNVVVSTNLASPAIVTEADSFDIAAFPNDGTRYLVYERDGDLFYRSDEAPGIDTELDLVVGGDPISEPRVSVDLNGNAHVVYQQSGDVFYVRKDVGQAFSLPQNVSDSPSPSTEAEIWITSSGVFFFFSQDNDLWRAAQVGPFFQAPENLTNSPLDEESEASYAIDAIGILHLAFVREGQVIYQNDAEVPVPVFTTSTQSGEVPVEVEFFDASTGVVTNWFWDFGDGETSTEQNPTHTYTVTGSYDVTLSVLGPGGQATNTVTDAIQVIDPTNFMMVASIPVFQQQTGVYVPVYAINADPLQGYQVAARWDCDTFDVSEITVLATEANLLFPEFVAPEVYPDECEATLGVVFDILAPFDGRTLPPGSGRRLANLILDIPADAPVGPSFIELVNGAGDADLFNIFNVNGVSVLPVLVPGEIEILPFVFPPPPLFIRGDVDFNSALQITDAINLLDFLFAGGPSPICSDAADANDSGAIDVSDVIFLLDFLFQFGALPAPPYPNPGIDPTPDPLPEC